MRIIFAGTSDFAKVALESLLNARFNMVAVYTQPDRPAGRGQQLKMSPVKCFAQEYQIPIYQPITLRDATAQQTLQDLKPDVMVVAAYGLLLPKTVLSIPPLGCMNIHASLLPRWRGAAPIQRAIMAGDEVTGITIMQMDEGLDTGNILFKSIYPIAKDETSATLFDRLATLGGESIVTVLQRMQKKDLISVPQDDALACYAKKIHKTEACIDWQHTAIQLDRMIRAFNPWPVAYSYLDGEMVRIWKANPVFENQEPLVPGTIFLVNKESITVATGEGLLVISQVQFPGGKPLLIKDILNAKPQKFVVGKQFTSE